MTDTAGLGLPPRVEDPPGPTEGELRSRYHRHLKEIDDRVVELYALVGEGLAAATDAFLSGDQEIARVLAERDELIDSLYRDVEELVNHELALQGPVAADLRFLLTVLRVVPELERSHDLVEHIARRATGDPREDLTPRIRGLIERMGALGVEMWRTSADAWVEQDADVYARLLVRDDEMDQLHAELTSELAAGTIDLPVALDMALIARFYERLGDHAVNVARRVCYLAGRIA